MARSAIKAAKKAVLRAGNRKHPHGHPNERYRKGTSSRPLATKGRRRQDIAGWKVL